MCSRFDIIPAYDRQTDRRTYGGTDKTDGIAIDSTALAMRALRHALKTLVVPCRALSWTVLLR